MPNQVLRARLTNSIDAAVREARDAAGVDHSGLRGQIREIAVEQIFRRVLPGGFDIGTGKIVDHFGGQSAQSDIVIYNRSILAPMMYSERDGLFPVESVIFSIEVKSRLNATEIDDALVKGRQLRTLQYQSGQRDPNDAGKFIQHPWDRVIFCVFAFSSDLKEGGKTELDRYRERDSSANIDSVFRCLCVIGRGFWATDQGGPGKWMTTHSTAQYDEVIDFVGAVSGILQFKAQQRGFPDGSVYLSDPEVNRSRDL